MQITQDQLIDKGKIHFNNEQWCSEVGSDLIFSGFISVTESNGIPRFIISLNGKMIPPFKTFVGMKDRLTRLFQRWNLEFIDNDTAAWDR